MIVFASSSSIIYPHAPLVSFAAIAGTTLSRRRAILTALIIWFVNQLYGYTIRQYPQTHESLFWGLVMGLGTVLATLIASINPSFSHRNWAGKSAWLGIALLLGFVSYQSSILLLNQWMGMHGLTFAVFARIFVRDAVWAIALFMLHNFLVMNYWRSKQVKR